MKKVLALLALAALCAPALAAGAEVDPRQMTQCQQPDFPNRSTSTESVRRVEKSLKAWRACFRAATAQRPNVDDMVAAAREYQLVKAHHEAWVNSTIQHSNGQPYGRIAAARVERDFWENLMATRAESRGENRTESRRSRRQDDVLMQQAVVGAN